MRINQYTIRLALASVEGFLKNLIYHYFNIDLLKPIHVIAKINSVCNSRCKMCHSWRTKEKSSFSWLYSAEYTEMPADKWIGAFEALKQINPNIKISFLGGEVFLKEDVFNIFKDCHQKNLIWSVTSNGIALDDQRIQNILKLSPAIINISIDSLRPNIYSDIRGVNKLHIVLHNIDSILYYIRSTKSRTLLCLKTMICKANVDELPQISAFASKLGAAAITFQPIFKTTKEGEEMFNVDFASLEQSTRNLIEMKRQGGCILNSTKNMLGWKSYFANKKEKRAPLCTVPLNNIYLFDNGDIKLCEFDDVVVGNITKKNIHSILKSELVKTTRKRLSRCYKQCSYCVKRGLADYLGIAKIVIFN